MDVNKLCEMILDAKKAKDPELFYYLKDLKDWLNKGGFEPDWEKFGEIKPLLQFTELRMSLI